MHCKESNRSSCLVNHVCSLYSLCVLPFLNCEWIDSVIRCWINFDHCYSYVSCSEYFYFHLFLHVRMPIAGGLRKSELIKGITFDNVSFGYPNRPLLFTNVSFHMPAGKITAVVGPSGSGKSTIANLVLRSDVHNTQVAS